MRHPNGYGSVVKLSGNRRRPFWVRKTIGWNEKRHPMYETIGYYATRRDGLIALAEYNKSPWNIKESKMTFEQVYQAWFEKKGCKLKISSQNMMKTAYNYTLSIRQMTYKDIKSFHMQECIEYCNKSNSLKSAIKNLFVHLDKFALEIDLISKTYSQLLPAIPINESEKRPFTEDEIHLLWEHENEAWIDTILIFLYTGFRISELLEMKRAQVDIIEKTMTGGIKTVSGKGRIVPIHPKIFPLIEKRYQDGNEYLLSWKGQKIGQENYRIYWKRTMDRLGMKHTPHECRHTFRSKLDSANANKKCIDLMMGHKSKEVGERVYTHKTMDELRQAIVLIN